MKVWLRLTIIISVIWVFAIAVAVALDLLSVGAGQCLFTRGGPSAYFSGYNGYFFSCSVFSDIPGHWWGVVRIPRGQQVLELSTYRLFMLAVPPLLALWVIFTGIPAGIKWALAGRRRSP